MPATGQHSFPNRLSRDVFISQFGNLSIETKQNYLNKMKTAIPWSLQNGTSNITLDHVFNQYSDGDSMRYEQFLNMMSKFSIEETLDIAVDLGVAIYSGNSPKVTARSNSNGDIASQQHTATTTKGIASPDFNFIIPKYANRTIGLSSDSKAEYQNFIATVKPQRALMPEFQPFSMSRQYQGPYSLNMLKQEMHVLEQRKRQRGHKPKWYEDYEVLRNGLRFVSLLRNKKTNN